MGIQWKKIEPDNELDKILYKTFTNKLRSGYAEFGEKKTCLSIHFEKIIEKCENLKVRDSDIFLCSYPKTGTTWSQEMIWMIVNNLDFEKGKQPIQKRFPFMEVSGIFSFDEVVKNYPNFKPSSAMADSTIPIDNYEGSPRLIKTHLPWDLLPKQIKTNEKAPKIIYVMRNAKDTCVSYFYHCTLEGYSGDFETYVDLFLAGKVCYGNYWNHVESYWEHRALPNILFIKYEDMKQDLSSVIKKVAAFIGKTLTEEQVSILSKHLSFENMKNNTAVNYSDLSYRKFLDNNADGIRFMRSGTVGGYKKDMTAEIEKRFDEYNEKIFLKTGIKI